MSKMYSLSKRCKKKFAHKILIKSNIQKNGDKPISKTYLAKKTLNFNLAIYLTIILTLFSKYKSNWTGI